MKSILKSGKPNGLWDLKYINMVSNMLIPTSSRVQYSSLHEIAANINLMVHLDERLEPP